MEETKAKKKFYKRWCFWVLAVVMFFIMVGALAENNSQKVATSSNNTYAPVGEKQPEAIKISVEMLLKEYQENEVSADSKYKGKLLEVTGIVDSIGKDIMDQPYITLKKDEEFAVTSVQAMFSSKSLEELGRVKKGQEIKIAGEGSGKSMNIILKKCSIVK